MASIFCSRPLGVGLGLGLAFGSYAALRPQHSRFSYCDAPAVSPKEWSYTQYQRDAKVPVVKKGGLNPRAVKQISSGSILGAIGGLAVSVFSKPLALLIGLLIIGLQAAESQGIHLIPYKRMQRYVSGIDLRSAIQDNVAFKLSFGATFALTGFAQL